MPNSPQKPKLNPPNAPHHANFSQITVHTAKCDSCDRLNKMTMYRCVRTGRHVCSLCWDKSSSLSRRGSGGGGGGGGYCNNEAKMKSDDMLNAFDNPDNKSNKSKSVASKENKEQREDNATTTRRGEMRKGVSDVGVVVSEDKENESEVDVDVVLRDSSTTTTTKTRSRATTTTKDDADADADKTSGVSRGYQTKKKRKRINMDHDHDDGLPSLWPIIPDHKPPAFIRFGATGGVKGAVVEGNLEEQEETEPEHYRQSTSNRGVYVGDVEQQGANYHHYQYQARYPSLLSNNGQAAHYGVEPSIHGLRPGIDVNGQAAAHYQYPFADGYSSVRQASWETHHPATTYQQPPPQIQPAIYRPQPGTEENQHAARSQPMLVDQWGQYHQAPQTDQASSISRQQAAHLAHGPAQASFYFSEQAAQNGAPIDPQAVRHTQAAYLNQQAQAYVNAKMMEARHRQGLDSQQSALLAAVNRDYVAGHNQQAFVSNGVLSSAAGYGHPLAVCDQREQQAYLARQQANRPLPGLTHASVLHGFTTSSSCLPAQPFHSQQHASPLAFCQAPPQTITGDGPNGTLAGTQVQEYSPEMLQAADALLYYAGIDRSSEPHVHSSQGANDSSQSPSAASRRATSTSAYPKSRSSIVSESEPGLKESSTPMSNRSDYHSNLSQSNPGLPMSNRAAAYIDQWNFRRAAQSSNSRSSTTEVRLPGLNRSCSVISTSHPQSLVNVNDTTEDEDEPGEDVEASMQAASSPISVAKSEEVSHVNAVTDSKFRRGGARILRFQYKKVEKDTDGENHMRRDGSDDGKKTSKEYKGSGDLDVVDARKRGIKEEHHHSQQIDDEASDVEIVSWNNRLRNKSSEKNHGTNVQATEQKSGRTMKKGVAFVKKPEPKRKRKQSST